MTDINLHQELQNINIKLAETNSDLKALCKKVTAFVDNGAPRCADQEARLKDLEEFKASFERGEHAICAVGKTRWEDITKQVEGLKRAIYGVTSALVAAIVAHFFGVQI